MLSSAAKNDLNRRGHLIKRPWSLWAGLHPTACGAKRISEIPILDLCHRWIFTVVANPGVNCISLTRFSPLRSLYRPKPPSESPVEQIILFQRAPRPCDIATIRWIAVRSGSWLCWLIRPRSPVGWDRQRLSTTCRPCRGYQALLQPAFPSTQ